MFNNLFLFFICNKIRKVIFYKFFFEQVSIGITFFECLCYLFAEILFYLFQSFFIGSISFAFGKYGSIFFQRVFLVASVFYFELAFIHTHGDELLVIPVNDIFDLLILFGSLLILCQNTFTLNMFKRFTYWL